MKLLDTSVAIDHLRGSRPAVDLLTGLLEAGEHIPASEVVRFELLAGVRRKEADTLEQFFTAMRELAGNSESTTRSSASMRYADVRIMRAMPTSVLCRPDPVKLLARAEIVR